MSAPNKIYVSADPFGFMHAYDAENYPPDGEAYIRKDYLLEWAKGEQNKCSDETHPYAMFMNVVIDKLNEI